MLAILQISRPTDLLGDEALQDLPPPVHGSQTLGEVGLIAALPLHVLAADLQHRLIHKVHRQLLTGQIDPETLSRWKRHALQRKHSITSDQSWSPITGLL